MSVDAPKLHKGIGPCSGKRSLPGNHRVVDVQVMEDTEVCEDTEMKQNKDFYQFHENGKGYSHLLQSCTGTSFKVRRKTDPIKILK